MLPIQTKGQSTDWPFVLPLGHVYRGILFCYLLLAKLFKRFAVNTKCRGRSGL